MSNRVFDPTWNYLPRTILIYVVPLGMLAVCFQMGNVSSSRDFWVPFLWGLIILGYNTRLCAERPWAFKDFMNRDSYSPMIALIHAVVWYIGINTTGSIPMTMLAYSIFFLTYTGLLIHYRLLSLYAIAVDKHKRGVLRTLVGFGFGWWAWISIGLGLSHGLGKDTIVSIALCSFAMIAPIQIYLSIWISRRNKPERFQNIKSVAVVGGGWSGIYTTKWLTDCGLEATCFEATDSVGGIWKFREDRPGGVFKNTRTTTSKHYLHASDFPMHESLSDFPYHLQVLEYLENYVDHFGIRDRIRLNTRVLQVKKERETWRIVKETKLGEREESRYDAVVICTGPQGQLKLNVSEDPLYHRYDGKILHAAEYKQRSDVGKNETILMVGAGESAADIVDECVAEGAKVYWSFYKGQWFVDRNLGPFATDHFVAPGMRTLAGRFMYMEYIIRRIIGLAINFIWGQGGHGIPGWIPDAPYLHQFLNKSRDAIVHVYSGRVKAMGVPVRIDGKKVYFDQEDDPVIIDRIILATGYQPSWPFLEAQPNSLYKKVFHPENPTLAFVGFARPIIGSIPSLSELQARWVGNVWSGAITLPCRARRDVALYLDTEHQERNFKDSSRLGVFVDQEVYATELAGYVNAHVHWLKLLLSKPRAFFIVLLSPWTAFKYQLNDPSRKKRTAALENIRRELPTLRHPYSLLLSFVVFWTVLWLSALALGLWYLPLEIVTSTAAAVILTISCILRLSEMTAGSYPKEANEIPVKRKDKDRISNPVRVKAERASIRLSPPR